MPDTQHNSQKTTQKTTMSIMIRQHKDVVQLASKPTAPSNYSSSNHLKLTSNPNRDRSKDSGCTHTVTNAYTTC